MNLNNLIMNTLAPTNVPVRLLTYPGPDTTYITFFEYNQQGTLFADDIEQETQFSIQVDVWSKGNYKNLVVQVRTLMINAGFTRNGENEFYETDTQIFHKVMRFYYVN